MIYKKDANFPYPIISEASVGYEDGHYFQMKIGFEEDGDVYRFSVQHTLESNFMKRLLMNGQAQFLLVIQSKDTKFYPLKLNEMYVEILKRKISLESRTSIQLHIVANEVISFQDHSELTPFYAELKHEIEVPKYSMLGFSNIVTFEGSMNNPTQLFEKRVNPELHSAVKFVLESEYIVIEFKDEAFQLQTVGQAFMNPYLYTGLRVALERFVRNYAEEDEEYVELRQIEAPTDLLDFKLYNLMEQKSVTDLHFDNLDEVIAKISSGIIEKFVHAVKGLKQDED